MDKDDIEDSLKLMADMKKAWINTIASGYFTEYSGFMWIESDKIPTDCLPEPEGPFIVTGLF